MQTCPLIGTPHKTLPEESSKEYSLSAAFLKEIRENPLRSSLNAIQTVSIAVGVISYLLSFADPPLTFIQVPSVLLQADTAGKLTGGAQLISEGETPIRTVSGYLVGVGDGGQLFGERAINLTGPMSMMSGYGLTLRFDRAPEHIVFCLKTTNDRGAVADQRLVLGLAQSAQFRQYTKTTALYQRMPNGEAPAKPACKT